MSAWRHRLTALAGWRLPPATIPLTVALVLLPQTLWPIGYDMRGIRYAGEDYRDGHGQTRASGSTWTGEPRGTPERNFIPMPEAVYPTFADGWASKKMPIIWS